MIVVPVSNVYSLVAAQRSFERSTRAVPKEGFYYGVNKFNWFITSTSGGKRGWQEGTLNVVHRNLKFNINFFYFKAFCPPTPKKCHTCALRFLHVTAPCRARSSAEDGELHWSTPNLDACALCLHSGAAVELIFYSSSQCVCGAAAVHHSSGDLEKIHRASVSARWRSTTQQSSTEQTARDGKLGTETK